MTPEQELVEALYGDGAVSGIVGQNVIGGRLPRNDEMPAICYFRISTERTVRTGSYTLDHGYTGFCRARFQFDAWAEDYPTAIDLARVLRLVLCRLDLTGGGNSKANMIGQERDLSDPNMIGQFRRVIDALIWIQEEGRDG